MTTEVQMYQRVLAQTLIGRRMVRQAKDGRYLLPAIRLTLLLPDRVVILFDLERMNGLRREDLLDEAFLAQLQAALGGRRVVATDSAGLALQIGRTPGEPRHRLPKRVVLSPALIPPDDYVVCLGIISRGPLHLDLAVAQRAIMIAGASGAGKTMLLKSILLQLTAKHGPDALQVAIVDTKQVDFAAFASLPHLFAPIACDVATAEALVERVEGERLRRQDMLHRAGVVDWLAYNRRDDVEHLPLLLLLVDEAADFAGTPMMETLVKIARKGRAFGISPVVATQHPEARVISAQVRANLPTVVAFQTRTHVESQVILGRGGAETLRRPGLALTFLQGRWQRVQTLYVPDEEVHRWIGQACSPEAPLSELERQLVRYALEHLDGAFIINALYEAFHGRISKRRLTTLARQWEARGWLTPPQHDPSSGHERGRYVTRELLQMAGMTASALPLCLETVTR